MENTNLDAVWSSGCDTGDPLSSRLLDIVGMNQFRPAATHDCFGRAASVVEQASVAVIDRPVRCCAPEHHGNRFGHLAQVQLTLPQCLVGSGEFRCPSSDSLIELGREPLLVAQEPGFSEADRRLIGRHAENQSLRFAGEVRSPGSSHEGANLPLQPQRHGNDRNLCSINDVSRHRRPIPWVGSQPLIEHHADIVRLYSEGVGASHANHLDGRFTGRTVHPGIHEIQAEHAAESFEQSAEDVGRVAARPDRREREDADQIVDAALQPLGLSHL